MSISETAKLLEETRSIVYDEPGDHSGGPQVTLSTIHTLLTQMNSKLSSIELKNNTLDTRLSTIEAKINSLDQLQGTLDSMKMQFNRLEEETKSTKRDLKALDSNMDSLGKLFDSVNSETKAQKKIINENCKDIEMCKNSQKVLDSDLQTVKEISVSLQNSVIDLKARSMHDNLVFTGIQEQKGEDTEQVLQDFLQSKYKLEYRIDFERVHRMGKWNEFSVHPRKIVAKFSYFKDREYIRINAAKRLKGSKVYANEQFPPKIEEKRRKLYPVQRQAKKDNKRVQLVRDVLYIDGKEYTPPESAPSPTPAWNNRTPSDRNPKRARVSSTPDNTK